MNLRIKDFPLYTFDPETDILTNWHGKQRCVRGKKSFLLRRGEIFLRVTYNRLKFAVEHNCGYDEIPHEYVIKDGEVIEKSDIICFAHRKRQKDADERMKVLERKLKEILIMKHVYLTGDIKPAVDYIESKKNYLIAKAIKRFCISRGYAEMLFSEASLIMYSRIESIKNSVTELTNTTFGVMGKVKRRYNLNKSTNNERR